MQIWPVDFLQRCTGNRVEKGQSGTTVYPYGVLHTPAPSPHREPLCPYISLYTKVNFQKKTQEKRNLCVLGLGNNFLDMTLKNKIRRGKNSFIDFIKAKNSLKLRMKR